MTDTAKSAADDLVAIYWRHHAKWDMPSSLKGKQGTGENLTQLANDACLITEGLLTEIPVMYPSEGLSQRAILESRRVARKQAQLWAERKALLSRVESAMAELDGDEWYYFWGLHQILDILPQTMEEK